MNIFAIFIALWMPPSPPKLLIESYPPLPPPTKLFKPAADGELRQALKSHPDRVPSDSPERPARTKKFQQINDAYYTLSDPSRRRDYDSARSYHGFPDAPTEDSDPEEEEIPRQKASGGGGFPWSAFGFGAKNPKEEEKFSSEQFGSVFEEMLRDEGLAEGQEAKPTGKFWSLVGGLSGGAMGFIVANFPGALAGAVAGNRLGAVRDARGKSVYSVFQELPQGDKAKLLIDVHSTTVKFVTRYGECDFQYRNIGMLLIAWLLLGATAALAGKLPQVPLSVPDSAGRNISIELFDDLEELSRIVDIAYCVGTAGLGIQKPFLCASRCQDFKSFELVKTWNTGPLLSDSCGYIALSHPPSAPRIIVAFRGTYSIANAIIDLSTLPQKYVPYPGSTQAEDGSKSRQNLLSRSVNPASSRCDNCTVHAGFMRSWRHTRPQIIDLLENLLILYPNYRATLVGHSLGGAVAALASLDFHAKGWNPQVTTFGEPRLGNHAMMEYIDKAFYHQSQSGKSVAYRRVTHVNDPVPQLPLKEWGFRTHGEELYISKANLPPERVDVRVCEGDDDPRCLGGADASSDGSRSQRVTTADIEGFRGWVLEHAGNFEIPARFRIWQLLFAHRDYFWRLGLCIPGGDPHDWI
ncbi:MAG: hypothetical protein Q9226_001252 [Calogaya cf. arnoldii]